MHMHASDVGKFSVLCLCLQAEADLRSAQSEFDRQSEITKILLEGINSTHVSQIQSVILSDSALRVKRNAPLLHHFPVDMNAMSITPYGNAIQVVCEWYANMSMNTIVDAPNEIDRILPFQIG